MQNPFCGLVKLLHDVKGNTGRKDAIFKKARAATDKELTIERVDIYVQAIDAGQLAYFLVKKRNNAIGMGYRGLVAQVKINSLLHGILLLAKLLPPAQFILLFKMVKGDGAGKEEGDDDHQEHRKEDAAP